MVMIITDQVTFVFLVTPMLFRPSKTCKNYWVSILVRIGVFLIRISSDLLYLIRISSDLLYPVACLHVILNTMQFHLKCLLYMVRRNGNNVVELRYIHCCKYLILKGHLAILKQIGRMIVWVCGWRILWLMIG
jgi:hypothetical protein